MSVNWSICDCQDVTRFSNNAFKELIKELKRAGIRFNKYELNVPYYSGIWGSDFCGEILHVFSEVSDRLIEKDTNWIETLPDIVRAIAEVAHDSSKLLKID